MRAHEKARDAWWTVLFVDPIASRLVVPLANRTAVTPTQLTVVSLVVGLGAAAALWTGGTAWWIAGAAAYYVSFALDCMDGKLARLTGSSSLLGTWLDVVFDRVKMLAAATALLAGRFRDTGDETYLYLLAFVLFLDVFRHFHIREFERLQRAMAGDAPAPAADPGTAGSYGRIRDALARRRIRTHVFSSIEFQMAILILGPVTGTVRGTTAVSVVLFAAFEIAWAGRVLLSIRAHARRT